MDRLLQGRYYGLILHGGVAMTNQPRFLGPAIEDAISNDKLLVIAVTSKTAAAIESEDTAYGAGKTTFAMDLAFKFNHYDRESKSFYDFTVDRTDIANWAMVFTYLWYYPSRIVKALKEAGEAGRRIPFGVWDDPQFTAGAKSGVAPPIQELVGRLTTGRPEIACLAMTMPNVLDIASPLRRLIQYEVIIPVRGVFEVQQVRYRKDFRNPIRDSMRLVPVEAKDLRDKGEMAFPDLPPTVKARYNAWRQSQKLLKDDKLIRRLETYERVQFEQAPLPTTEPPRNKMAPIVAAPPAGRKENEL